MSPQTRSRAESKSAASRLRSSRRGGLAVMFCLACLLVGAPAWGDVAPLDPPGATAPPSRPWTQEVTVNLAAPNGAGSCLDSGSLPEGVTVEFSPSCGEGAFGATMTVTVGEDVEAGDYTIETLQSCQASGSEEPSGEESPGDETAPAAEQQSSCSGSSTFALKVVSFTGEPTPTTPSETTEPPPPDEPDPVQKLLNRMTRPGRILYNPPSQMTVGQSEIVEVRITRDPDVALTPGLIGPGEPVEEEVPVANEMIVELVGPDFEITPLSPKRQVVGGEGFNEWAFEIAPEHGGDLFLRLTVSVELDGKKVKGVRPRVLQRKIEVDVDPFYTVTSFVGRNWQPVLLTAVAVATLLFGSGILVSRRREEAARTGGSRRPTSRLGLRRNRPRT